MDPNYVDSLIEQLAVASERYTPSSEPGSTQGRHELAQKARELILAISSPLDFTFWQFANINATICLRTIIDLGVLKQIPSTGTIGLEELAQASAVQPSLLERLLRALVGTQVLNQDEQGNYSHTRLSQAYSADFGPGMILKMTYDDVFLNLSRLPAYLKHRGSATEPDDQAYNPFSWGHRQEGKTVWQIMSEQGTLEGFQRTLASEAKAIPPTGFFDFGALATENGGERPILVDVGGGIGRTIKAIIESSPDLFKSANKFVLQDLPGPIQQAKHAGLLPTGVHMMVHDMFTEQPLKGAKAYYLRRILHDYSDEKCVCILSQLAAAAAPDTLVLISELLVPAKIGEAELPIVNMDMSVMNMGGKERTERGFTAILELAGLEIVKVWKGFRNDALIEARVQNA